jgi:hypothetical protein
VPSSVAIAGPLVALVSAFWSVCLLGERPLIGEPLRTWRDQLILALFNLVPGFRSMAGGSSARSFGSSMEAFGHGSPQSGPDRALVLQLHQRYKLFEAGSKRMMS